jgi:hypothetical protein
MRSSICQPVNPKIEEHEGDSFGGGRQIRATLLEICPLHRLPQDAPDSCFRHTDLYGPYSREAEALRIPELTLRSGGKCRDRQG